MMNRQRVRTRWRGLPWAASFAMTAAALHGCGDSAATVADAGRDVPPADVPPPPPTVRLSVDADRNGTVAADGADVEHRADWSLSFGATLLANLDDDDSDHAVDAEDDAVNGENDAQDLARVRVLPIPRIPAGASAHLTIDEPNLTRIRLFRHNGDAWEVWDATNATLSDADLRTGVEFGIESTQFPNHGWNGSVTLTLTVTAQNGTEVGRDVARMRTAPWVMANVLGAPIKVWIAAARGYPAIRLWNNDMELATTTDNVELVEMNALDSNYHARGEGPDVWMQDIMEFGWSSIPAAEGPHIMHSVIRTPNTRRAAGSYTQLELLGPDFGYVYPHASAAANGGSAHDPSLDSFGDLEMIPPYDNGDHHFPLGRILHGSVPTRHADVDLEDMLDAQGIQGEVLRVDTSWLYVGHIDELVSFVPATNTPRGWKLLIAAPALARTLLQQLVDRDPANGDLMMFRGQNFYRQNADGSSTPYAAQRTINAILADASLMALNQQVQARVTMLRMLLQSEIGLTDADIVETPFLFMAAERGRSVAMMPGTVNLLSYNHTVVVARPHSIPISGADYFETDMVARMMPLGLTTRFAEQWDTLHAADGEVHCGSNVLREVPRSRWWEVAQ